MSDLHFTDMPEEEKQFEVGDMVEVFCDHDNDKDERVRDWLQGVIVQIDPKMIAVQFLQNVYLTEGWMVPDHVIWCPHDSKNIRRARKLKRRPRQLND